MYREILIPTDGSDCANRAADHAIDVAADHDARLHVLSVVDTSARTEAWADVAGVPADGGGTASVVRERYREAVESVADRAQRRGIETVTAVETGRPHRRILKYARENDVDLVVVGTHGRTGLERVLIGSVAESVVRNAPVPVLCVTGSETPTVDTAEKARSAARRALERRGHADPSFPEPPSRQRSSWVVPAESDGTTFNVHVSPTGETSVATLDDAPTR